MLKIRILIVSILLSGGPASGQINTINLYGDTLHTDCSIAHEWGQIAIVAHVFHYSSSGAMSSRFSAPDPGCFIEGTYARDIAVFPATTGNSQTGITINYGACLTGWIFVLSIIYMDVTGLGSPDCCAYPVLADPSAPSGQIEILDCSNNVVPGGGISGIVNGTPQCPCDIVTGIFEYHNTWGRIKSLYTE
jgi:hypothetical protein